MRAHIFNSTCSYIKQNHLELGTRGFYCIEFIVYVFFNTHVAQTKLTSTV